jgi:hypothetical protein
MGSVNFGINIYNFNYSNIGQMRISVLYLSILLHDILNSLCISLRISVFVDIKDHSNSCHVNIFHMKNRCYFSVFIYGYTALC